jgi:hypothetical protein
MHWPWALVLASVAACAGPAATQTATPSDPPEQLRMMDRGDLLGAR